MFHVKHWKGGDFMNCDNLNREALLNMEIPTAYAETMSYYEYLRKVIKELQKLENDFYNMFDAKVLEFFNQIMPNVIYKEDEECIYFSFSKISGGDTHVYDSETKTMSIT